MGELKGFEVIDRRGQKREEAPVIIATAEPEEKREGDSWKSVAYLLVPVQTQIGMITVCKAVGMRSDAKMFVADYALSPYYRDLEGWAGEAKKRLDTFLNCNCKTGHQCGTHNMLMQQWQNADSQRLEFVGTAQLPECLEVFMKAAQARAQGRIVVPDNGHH